MTSKLISIVLCFTLVLLVMGCATIEEHKGAAVGAGIGAAVGTAAGAIVGEGTGAAVLGGVLGALAGGAIGHYSYDKPRTRDETVEAYNYQLSTGYLVTIEEALASPETAGPGDVVQLQVRYAILSPSPDTKITITEVREITHNGELVGKPEVRVERVDGTYTSTVPLRLPANAKNGVYSLRTTVQSEYAKDTRETSFTVE